MHQNAGSQPLPERQWSHDSGSSEAKTGSAQPGEQQAQSRLAHQPPRPTRRNGEDKSLGQIAFDFVQQHPVVATGAAFAVGAVAVMAISSRRTRYDRRLDRRALRAARSFEKNIAREISALRRADVADRMGHLGSSLSEMLSRIDLSPLAERGRDYMDAARNRLNL